MDFNPLQAKAKENIPIINVKGIETRKNPKVKKKVFNLTSKR